MFFISNSRQIVNVAIFLLGDSPVSEFYVLMFRNTSLFHLHRSCEQEETSAHIVQTPGNHPKERIHHMLFKMSAMSSLRLHD
jgi:hypothetical protein